MRNRISERLANWLVREHIIEDEEEDLYAFATFNLFFELIPILIALILGLLFSLLLESILMIIPLILIRKFAGGYHLKSPWICIATSSVFLTVVMIMIRMLLEVETTAYLTCAVIVAVICIFCCSPIDSEERRLSEAEERIFRKIAIGMTGIFFLAYIVLLFCDKLHFTVSIGVGIVAASILQMPCIVNKLLYKISKN